MVSLDSTDIDVRGYIYSEMLLSGLMVSYISITDWNARETEGILQIFLKRKVKTCW